MSGSLDQYRYLRATTDCILAYQVGDALEFHGDDALKVADLCCLPLGSRWQDLKGQPIPMCSFPVEVLYDPNADQTRVSLNADYSDAILGAALPMALALEVGLEDGVMQRRIILDFRPRPDRPALRGV